MSKLACISDSRHRPQFLDNSAEVVFFDSLPTALLAIQAQHMDGLIWAGNFPQLNSETILAVCQTGPLEDQSQNIFDLVPIGFAVLDSQFGILQVNQQLRNWFVGRELIGLNFFQALDNAQSLGPDSNPLQQTLQYGTMATTLLETSEYFLRLYTVPIFDQQGKCIRILATLNDCTESVEERKKLGALHRAGAALADIRPEEISEMQYQERVDLLKDNIIHFTRDLLNFDVVEIRKLEPNGLLLPILSVGINAEQAKMPIYARESGNGVSGFVAATGESYLCEDTTQDPLYLKGLIGAKSSLTVPLVFHDEVIGTFNVERPQMNAFSESDLRFLEMFARDVAVALKTLDLLDAQHTNTARESVSAIRSGVGRLIDGILNDTVFAMDVYSDEDQAVTQRLQSILDNAREIKEVIRSVGDQMKGIHQIDTTSLELRQELNGKRILVIDADQSIREMGHQILEKHGCIVETAHSGQEAMLMVRTKRHDQNYDAIISDMKMSDLKGNEIYIKLKNFFNEPPLILTSEFGYDKEHTLLKAVQAGLRSNALIIKPFQQKQLLDMLESITREPVHH